MTFTEEGLLAMRGCWRFLRRDPDAFEDFNLTIDGFWRSFAMILPVLVLVYPAFLVNHAIGVAFPPDGESPPELQLGHDYLFLLAGIAIWPLVAAFLARLFGVAQNYVRYMIIYNWMTVPMTAVAVIPHFFYLATGTGLFLITLIQVIFIYVSWSVAKAGLETTVPVAIAFVVADFALTFGLDALIR